MFSLRIKRRSSAVTFFLALMVVIGVLSLSAPGVLAAGPGKDAKPADDTKALLQARAALAEKGYAGAMEDLTRTRRFGNTLIMVGKPEDVHRWSVRWLHGRQDLSPRPEDQVAALEAHLKRMTELHEKVKQLHRDLLPQLAVDNAEWYVLEAKLWLAKAKARQAKAR